MQRTGRSSTHDLLLVISLCLPLGALGGCESGDDVALLDGGRSTDASAPIEDATAIAADSSVAADSSSLDATVNRPMDLTALPDLAASAPCGRVFAHTGRASINHMTVDSRGNLIVVGGFLATVDFGDGIRTSAGGYDAFVAKYDVSCKLLFAKTYGDAADQVLLGVSVDGADRIYFDGYIKGTIDVGNGMLASKGGSGIVVAALDANGNALWSRIFGATGSSPNLLTNSLTVDAAGAVMVGGYANGAAIDFGGGLVGQGSPNGTWIWFFKLDRNGAFVWSQGFGFNTSAANEITSIGLDRAGNLIVAGIGQGTIDFGGGAITFPANGELFLLKRSSATGAHILARAFAGASQVLSAIGLDAATGDLVVSGQLYGIADFGNGPIGSSSNGQLAPARAFIARLHDDTLGAVWSRAFGSNPTTSVSDLTSLALSSSGEIDVTVQMNVTVDFGCGAIGPSTTNPPLTFALVHLATDGSCLSSATYGDGLGYAAVRTPSGSLAYAGAFTNVIGGPGIAPMMNPGGKPNQASLDNGFLVRLGR